MKVKLFKVATGYADTDYSEYFRDENLKFLIIKNFSDWEDIDADDYNYLQKWVERTPDFILISNDPSIDCKSAIKDQISYENQLIEKAKERADEAARVAEIRKREQREKTLIKKQKQLERLKKELGDEGI